MVAPKVIGGGTFRDALSLAELRGSGPAQNYAAQLPSYWCMALA
jgi:hypothetical protein